MISILIIDAIIVISLSGIVNIIEFFNDEKIKELEFRARYEVK